ncbi:MAG TPA: rRNA adenine dimethyltransferase family protein [Candidatus Nanoarchaeia archaeon]|nr:rRNA adenine dimethyltransferase family protein [Candidatus Nanoarchaeia archaeon]
MGINESNQHFLTDQRLLREIAQAAQVSPDDVVLEVGAGPGNLTRLLCAAKLLIAVEKDGKFRPALLQLRQEHKNIRPLFANILLVPPPKADIVIGNIPYNISEPLFYQLMRASCKRIILLVSARFYRAITGQKLSLLLPYYFTLERLIEVPRTAFSPKPRVDSVLIRLIPKKERSLPREVLDQQDKRVKNAVEHALWQQKGWSKRQAGAWCREHLPGISGIRLRQLSHSELKALLAALNNV